MRREAPVDSMKVRRVKVVEEIIESLRQDIVTRKLAPGERMPSERELSERYGVSQPTVREAIRALETLGLVDVVHGSGSYISAQGDYGLASALQTLLQLQGVGIIEVLDVRQILGRASVEMAASKPKLSDVQRIQDAIDRLDALEDAKTVEEVTRRIIDFQRAVSAAARNPLLHSLEVFLATLLIEVQVTALRSRGVRFWRTRAGEFQADRCGIRDGIKMGSPKKARAAMDQYFDDQRSRFLQDEALRSLNLSDPRLISMVTQIVRSFKN
ncbi:MAG TPA: GntR family transcriptional regulator [Steroidobacteraceae bacterium]|nr:GntR family transcriptional regulator [Steroidobacteraceae bacterium]